MTRLQELELSARGLEAQLNDRTKLVRWTLMCVTLISALLNTPEFACIRASFFFDDSLIACIAGLGAAADVDGIVASE